MQYKNQRSRRKTVWFFCYFNFGINYEVFKWKSPYILLNKNVNFKNKWESKMKISNTFLERQTLCFTSYKNHKLKVKLWWVGAPERKRAFFVPFILSKGNFWHLCFIWMYNVLKKLSQYTYFYISKNITFCL